MVRFCAVRVFAFALLLVAAGVAAAQTPTTVTLTATPTAASILGQAVTFTATVVPSGASGRVHFREGGQMIGDAPLDGSGAATFTTANLSTGAHAILAEYLGQGAFLPSTSAALSLTVNKRSTTMTVVATTPTVGVGENGLVTVTVTDTGTVGPPGAPGSFTTLPATMSGPRAGHTATRLLDGRVLVAGGRNDNGNFIDAAHSVELFDPAQGTFTLLAHGLLTPRSHHTATLLQDGTVLIVGGLGATGALASAERYDPATGEFTAVPGSLQTARYAHGAALLSDGTVLIVGGTTLGGGMVLSSIEAYRAGAFALASGGLYTARAGATVTLLADGASLLVAGGIGTSQSPTGFVELLGYDQATNVVTRVGLAFWPNPCANHTATLLPDGSVLFTGGDRGGYPESYARIYRPPAALSPFPYAFVVTTTVPMMSIRRGNHAATLLDGGLVLLTGGVNPDGTVASAETFRPAFEPSGTPAVSSTDLTDTVTSCALAFAGNGAARCAVTLVPAAIGTGSRTVTVSWAGDANHLAPEVATATASLSVERGDPVIDWSDPPSLTYGTVLGSSQLDAVARNATGTVAGTYAYSPPAGSLLDAGYRALSVTFTPGDPANYNAAAKTVHVNVTRATPTLRWYNPGDIVYGTPLGSTQLNATATGISGSLPGTFSYDPPAGTVLNAGSYQRLRVSFSPWDAANYDPASTQVYLSVGMAIPAISWAEPADITHGTPLSGAQLNATASTSRGPVPGTFSYTPAAGTVLGAGAGQVLTATFTPTDRVNFSIPTARNVTIDVRKATPAISWADPAGITYGNALSGAQLNATATGVAGPLAGSFAYAPEAGSVLGAGPQQQLSVTFSPDDSGNYAPATRAVHLDVGRATPGVVWANPAPILHGTPLGAAQLDAAFFSVVDGVTVPVSGTALYSPPGGTVLAAGEGQPLTVEFVPDDVIDYASPPATTVALDVLADLAIAPASATVAPGKSMTFTASGGSGHGWSWSLVTNPSGGRITADGVYTAGSTARVSDVVQVRDSEGNTATASVSVESPPAGNGGGGCASTGSGSPLAIAGLVLALALRRRRRA